jgi:hypothetical protein
MNSSYRVKITGFTTGVTPSNLTEKFGPNNYYIDRKHDHVGYIVKIKTMKYAKQLMTKLHNKDIDGQKIKCQLELNPISYARRDVSRGRAASIDGELKPTRARSRSRPRDTYSLRSSKEASDLGDPDDTLTITYDNRELERDRRISGKALYDITQTPSKTNLNHTRSSETLTTPVDTKC